MSACVNIKIFVLYGGKHNIQNAFVEEIFRHSTYANQWKNCVQLKGDNNMP